MHALQTWADTGISLQGRAFHAARRSSSLNHRLPRLQATTSSIVGCAETDFTVPVQIGTQTFNLILDTGSTTLAVASTLCDSTCSGVSPRYGNTGVVGGPTNGDSSTYGDGSGWTGTTYTDVVSVGGITTAVTMKLASITSSNSFFTNGRCNDSQPASIGYQGIIGMAYPALEVPNTDAWVFSTNPPRAAALSVFALRMCLDSGTLWIDTLPSLANSTSWFYTPIVSQTYYTVDLIDMQVNCSSLNVAASDFGTTIVDSGTSLIVLPTTAFDALVARVQQSPTFQAYFPNNFFTGGFCYSTSGLTTAQLNAQLPLLTFVIGDLVLTVSAVNSYLVELYDDVAKTMFYCPGIQTNGAVGFTILGWAFMTNWLVAFDVANSRIGFAIPNTCSDSTGAHSLMTRSASAFASSSGASQLHSSSSGTTSSSTSSSSSGIKITGGGSNSSSSSSSSSSTGAHSNGNSSSSSSSSTGSSLHSQSSSTGTSNSGSISACTARSSTGTTISELSSTAVAAASSSPSSSSSSLTTGEVAGIAVGASVVLIIIGVGIWYVNRAPTNPMPSSKSKQNKPPNRRRYQRVEQMNLIPGTSV